MPMTHADQHSEASFSSLEDFAAHFPKTGRINAMLLEKAPSHKRYLKTRFAKLDGSEIAYIEGLAEHIENLCGDELEEHVDDYIFICDMQMKEEIYFRRHGRYRLNTFAEALEQVYSNTAFMKRYMNGLLMTQLWWSNHTKVMGFYQDRFLAGNRQGSRHLEIGPGHGLLLHMAIQSPNTVEAEAWDISAASIASTRHALESLGSGNHTRLLEVDMFDAPETSFDSLVFAEVLEHMEKPAEALAALRARMKDDARLFIHVPINSPAPDHLFNQPTPEDMCKFITGCGFVVEDKLFAPMTNHTLENAVSDQLTVSCAFILRKSV